MQKTFWIANLKSNGATSFLFSLFLGQFIIYVICNSSSLPSVTFSMLRHYRVNLKINYYLAILSFFLIVSVNLALPTDTIISWDFTLVLKAGVLLAFHKFPFVMIRRKLRFDIVKISVQEKRNHWACDCICF